MSDDGCLHGDMVCETCAYVFGKQWLESAAGLPSSAGADRQALCKQGPVGGFSFTGDL